MKAMTFEEFGGPEVLHAREVDEPRPAAGQVLVEVHHAGVNPIDWKIRRGFFASFFAHEFPITSGWDLAGVVREVGPDVDDLAPGDRVFGMNMLEPLHHGSYAELAVAPRSVLARLPDGLSFAQGAAIPLTTLTANIVTRTFGRLQPGQRCLVQAGAGGVGSLAIQLAKRAGARVYTTASVHNGELVQSLGADAWIDYRARDFASAIRDLEPEGLDLIVDAVGGETLGRSYGLLREGGRLASLVDFPDEALAAEHGIEAKFIGTTPDPAVLEELGALFASGALTLPPIEERPLAQAAAAQALSEEGHVRGKLVLSVHEG